MGILLGGSAGLRREVEASSLDALGAASVIDSVEYYDAKAALWRLRGDRARAAIRGLGRRRRTIDNPWHDNHQSAQVGAIRLLRPICRSPRGTRRPGWSCLLYTSPSPRDS